MVISFLESIRKRRKELRISQTHLAEIAGLSINTISKIERGEANPTVDVLEKIADVLGLELRFNVKNTNKIYDESSASIFK